jgi:2-dehydro-3-deoxyphosphogluconate aldolase/(4S)-4-hydroxy-2-oxoglutarate aldolase
MMKAEEVFSVLKKHVVIPVMAIESAEDALPLADALIEGGLPVAEITFRTTAAATVISRIARERPQLVLGAGTILTKENLAAAIDAGARFGVAPGLNPDILAEANRRGLPFVPGVVTPSEVEKALSMGAKLLKFFPSEASGGIQMIKALSGPYAHTGVRFVPTGGVSAANLADYLSVPAVACVGGTWIASKEAIAGKKWAEIAENCRAAVKIVAAARPS